ncbi:hypothetical protein COW81_00380 [Candidatus Campbellbacteria bacterium CG22_combo_CG10-13_8_21_14_all_36_13]|uniref:Transcription regulator TrmB N-terminal domain-containing protein n=1 Tax=Candidatus Campbellbacteria bacterium CG22_combo_CG10-13_8_21_14_all_36_13 TaxID=1974529 RepID=A0A2H0E0N2_9BACT|nr:MAG: hypothetical protein COW81_00380 [Candidatus Campbellbacteria bacterium CG22_combo_CG10-13_8_21_14_all_36_13]
MTIQEAIESIGLSEKEARVYLALLEIGTGSAYGIAVKSGLKRPTAYVILEELAKKGVVSLIPRSSKKLYRAKNPEYLFEEMEERFIEAKNKLPEIKAKTREESFKPQVLFFEGVGGVKESLKYGLKDVHGKTIKGFYAKTTPEIMKNFDGFKDYNNYLKENDISMEGVAPEDESLVDFRKTDKDYGRTIKIVSKNKYSSDVSIEVGENWVKMNDYQNLQGLIIDNPAIAKTIREIFEMVWEKTE